jgi:hypothetical protein
MTRLALSNLPTVLLLVAPAVGAADAVRFGDLEGTYVSARHGGCRLELKKRGSFSLSCGSRTVKGQASAVGPGFAVIGGGGSAETPQPAVLMHGSTEDWPPSLRDPTRGPYVVSGPEGGESFWLEPLRWGSRLYLVRNGDFDGFCRDVQAGVEPRKTETGAEFLRRGDHLKPAAGRRPKVCDGPK